MSGAYEIRKAIRELAGGENTYALACEVLKVDEAASECDVKPINGDAEIYGVKLQPINGDGWVMIPKKGSTVIVNFIAQTAAFVAMFSEIESIKLKIQESEFKIDKEGFFIQKQNESLLKILTDLIKAIQKITVPTNVGPSGYPMNALAFEELKIRTKDLFK